MFTCGSGILSEFVEVCFGTKYCGVAHKFRLINKQISCTFTCGYTAGKLCVTPAVHNLSSLSWNMRSTIWRFYNTMCCCCWCCGALPTNPPSLKMEFHYTRISVVVTAVLCRFFDAGKEGVCSWHDYWLNIEKSPAHDDDDKVIAYSKKTPRSNITRRHAKISPLAYVVRRDKRHKKRLVFGNTRHWWKKSSRQDGKNHQFQIEGKTTKKAEGIRLDQ